MAQKRAGLKSPGHRQLSEERLLEDPLAREAFEKLTQKARVDSEKLLSLLLRIPYASIKVHPLVEEMEDRRVRALPDRIRNWADAIEIVNASPWLGPDRLLGQARSTKHPEHFPPPLNLTLTPEWAEPTAKQFHSLPRALRFYADHLQAWLEIFHPIGKRRRDLGFRTGIQRRKYLTLELLKLVRDSAQRPRYKEIAILLDAAYRVAGKARTISEGDLSQLGKNNPWLSWVLRDFFGSD